MSTRPAGDIVVPPIKNIVVTPTSIRIDSEYETGRNTHREFRMVEGVLWMQESCGQWVRFRALTPLLRQLLNDNI